MELVLRQVDYWTTVYKRTWRGSVVSSFLLPFLYLTAMGVGLGGYVDDAARTDALGGLSYLDFIAPGLLAATAMQTAIGEGMWPVMGAFKWHKTYYAQLATPLRPVDILNAHLGFVAFRLLTTCGVFLFVLVAFGAVDSWAGALAALLVSGLVGMSHATPIFAFSAQAESPDRFSVMYRLAVMPMFLFSGAFFPVSQLPGVIVWLAYVTPLWHGVELTRMVSAGQVFWLPAAGHLAYLSIWLLAGWWAAARLFRRRLVDGG
jgi:lipooligosaccharide transport system permease protein